MSNIKKILIKNKIAIKVNEMISKICNTYNSQSDSGLSLFLLLLNDPLSTYLRDLLRSERLVVVDPVLKKHGRVLRVLHLAGCRERRPYGRRTLGREGFHRVKAEDEHGRALFVVVLDEELTGALRAVTLGLCGTTSHGITEHYCV